MSTEIESTVIALLGAQVPAARRGTPLTPETELAQAGLDSLALMAFWVAFERATERQLDPATIDFLSVRTVRDVITQATAVPAPSPVPA